MKISFTVCTANYLPYAKSLADSVINFNPSHSFIIILLDKFPSINKSLIGLHTIIFAEEMKLEDFDLMNSKFNIFELSCAMKPYSADFIFKRFTNCEQLFYFDSDTLVYNSLVDAELALEKNSVLITPHLNTYSDFNGRLQIEKNFLKSGVFNAGFFALKKGCDAQDFISWWKLRVKIFGFEYVKDGLFVDQIWLNFAPAYFRFVHVFKHDGFNVAYWNMGERSLTSQKGKFYINDVPLVFFHFSGFDINNPEILSRFLNIYNFKNRPEFLPLFIDYEKKVKCENKNNLFSIKPYYGKPKPGKLENIILKWKKKRRRKNLQPLYPGEF